MSKLFGRTVSLTVGTLDVSELDCAFQVKKTLKPEPNTCALKIYNLSEKSRNTLETYKKAVPVRLEAGYGTEVSQLYFGELRTATSHYEDPGTFVTELSTGDGEAAKLRRIYQPVGPKAGVDVALNAIANALGVARGNVDAVVKKLRAKGVVTLSPRGSVLAGLATQAMTDLCRSADLEWSIQDGKLQILDIGKPLDGLVTLLSPETGLVGSPTVDNKGVASIQCLMQPGILPGSKISVESKFVRGGFRVEEVEYSGDTAGTDWYATIHAKRY